MDRRLLQLGLGFIFLGLMLGLAIPRFAVPRLGLSAHLLAITQGMVLCIVGLVWPRLALGPRAARFAFGALVYGCAAALACNVAAAALGGHALLALASAGANAAPELAIAIGLRTAALALFAATATLIWGLRRTAP